MSDAANFYSDYLLIKYDTFGDTIWTRTYNGSAGLADEVTVMEIDEANNIYITGKSQGTGTGFDIVTIKYNPDGVQQWVAVFNGDADDDDIPYDMTFDQAGNLYVVGSSYYQSNSTYTDGVLIKYSPEGT
ncbi:SBBP repeat-containing protein, partial [Arthrospira platensis SPKY1]|nr:SBBP repeat-containing protein [Arthrospira platensis SPKY1]